MASLKWTQIYAEPGNETLQNIIDWLMKMLSGPWQRQLFLTNESDVWELKLPKTYQLTSLIVLQEEPTHTLSYKIFMDSQFDFPCSLGSFEKNLSKKN